MCVCVCVCVCIFFSDVSQCIYIHIYKKNKECSKKQYFETNKFYGSPKIQKL